MADTIADHIRQQVSTKAGATQTCTRCGQSYKRGEWDFYSLCDPCFDQFDEQKMQGRFAFLTAGERPTDYYESVSEWMQHDKD